MYLNVYLFIHETGWHTTPICWFTPQLPTTSSLEPGQSQKMEFILSVPHGCQGSHRLSHQCCPPGCASARIREGGKTPSWGLSCCVLIFNKVYLFIFLWLNQILITYLLVPLFLTVFQMSQYLIKIPIFKINSL